MLKELFDLTKNIFEKFRYYHIFIFVLILLFNISSAIYVTLIHRRECTKEVLVKINSNDSEIFKHIKVMLLSPQKKVFYFKETEKEYQWLWNGFISEVVIALPEKSSSLIRDVQVKIGSKVFNYNKEEFTGKWKELNNKEKNLISEFLKDRDLKILFLPKDAFYARSLLPVTALKTVINYSGEVEIVRKKLNWIIFVSFFTFLYFYVLIYFFIIPYLRNNSFKKFLKLDDSRYILFSIFIYFLTIIFFVFLPLKSKPLLYYLSVLPISVLIFKIVLEENKRVNEKFFDKKNFFEAVIPNRVILVLLLVIIVSSFILRIVGINHGYPQRLDNAAYAIVDSSAEMLKKDTADPNFYMRPNHISIYLNNIFYDILSYIKFNKPVSETFEKDPIFFDRITRIISSILGTATVFVIYLIGKEFNLFAGIFSAALLAFNPSHIFFSPTVSPDITLTLFISFFILFSVKYIKSGSFKNILFMIIFSAFSTLEKYPGVITFFVLVVIFFIKNRMEHGVVRGTLKICFIFIAIVFILSPWFFIRIYSVIYSFFGEVEYASNKKIGYFGNILNYLVNYYMVDTGPILLFFLFFGIISLIKKKRFDSLPLFFSYIFIFLLSFITFSPKRWALPFYIGNFVITGYGAYVLFKLSLKNRLKIIFFAILSILFLISFLNVFFKSIQTTLDFTLKDTRYIAERYIKENKIKEDETLYTGRDGFKPSVKNNNFFIYLKNPMFSNKFNYYMLSSDFIKEYLLYQDSYPEETKLLKDIMSKKVVYKFFPYEGLKTDSFFEYSNIINGIKYIDLYFINRNKMYVGPEIVLYKNLE